MIDFHSSAENAGAANPLVILYNPGATIRGLGVLISQDLLLSDIVTGVTVQGGGGEVPLARRGTNFDSVGEFGRVYGYFLGSGIPAGALTIRVYRSESVTPMHAVPIGFSGLRDTFVQDSDGINENVANPQVILQTGGRSCMGVCVLYSGAGGVGVPVDLATQTRVQDHDYGAETSIVSRLTAVTAADFSIGYTIPITTSAFFAMAVAEVDDPGPGGPPPTPNPERYRHTPRTAPQLASRW